MDHVEIARAETERGELVLTERRDENAPASLELRANGVFVMDTPDRRYRVSALSDDETMLDEVRAFDDDDRTRIAARRSG